MSAPARKLTAPGSVPTPPRRVAGRTGPSPSDRHRPATVRRRRRQHGLGFALLASVLVGLMVFGIVVLNVLLAQQSFRIDEAERRLEMLGAEHLELLREQATLSAPGRIAAWASRHGMRLPDDIRILRAPAGPVDPAGAGISEVGSSTEADA